MDWGWEDILTIEASLHVLLEQKKSLTIPDAYLVHFPAVDLPIAKFIQLQLPIQSTAIITTTTKNWFSKDSPQDDIMGLFTRPILSKDFLTTLSKAFGQAWLDGAMSITDCRYNDGRDQLPLWVLTMWQKMAGIVDKQTAWKRSSQWLHTEDAKMKGMTIYQSSYSLHTKSYHLLGWDVPMHYQQGAVSSSILSALLSTVWLNDKHINMMMEELAARLALYPGLASKVIVAPLAFQVQINNSAKVKTYIKQKSLLLYCYHAWIKKEVEKIYFPINVNGDHWIAGVVDITAWTVSYGMQGSNVFLIMLMNDLRRSSRTIISTTKQFHMQGPEVALH